MSKKVDAPVEGFVPCKIMELAAEEQPQAAEVACSHNPANAPNKTMEKALRALVQTPEATKFALAIMTNKYWGTGGVNLTYGFMENVTSAFQKKIDLHFNAAGEFSNIKARWTQNVSQAQVRIAFANDGYWSYLGTDISGIPKNKPTMNLQGFQVATPDAEWTRVVRHEFLHTCGCPHEHSRKVIVERLDPAKVIAYFGGPPNNWSEADVRAQILTSIEESKLIAGTAEEDSLMAYWFPGNVTKDGRPILGGKDFTAGDKTLLAKAYPKADQPTPPAPPLGDLEIEIVAPGKYRLVKV